MNMQIQVDLEMGAVWYVLQGLGGVFTEGGCCGATAKVARSSSGTPSSERIKFPPGIQLRPFDIQYSTKGMYSGEKLRALSISSK